MTGTNNKNQGNENRRSRIITAARKLIQEKGYPSASLDLIVAEAGCSKSAVYKHFSSKEGLLIAISDEVIADLKRQLNSEALADAPVRQQLIEYVKLNMSLTHSEEHIAVMSAIFSAVWQSPEVGKNYINQAPNRAIEDLAQFFEEKTRLGELKVENCLMVARQFLGSFHWWWHFSQLLGEAEPPTKQQIIEETELLVDNFMKVYAAN